MTAKVTWKQDAAPVEFSVDHCVEVKGKGNTQRYGVIVKLLDVAKGRSPKPRSMVWELHWPRKLTRWEVNKMRDDRKQVQDGQGEAEFAQV